MIRTLRDMIRTLRVHPLTTPGALLVAALAAHPARTDAPVSPGPSAVPATVSLPGGRFRMGCLAGDQVCQGNERPAQTVTLAAFDLGRTEVTFDQWDACVAAGGCAQVPTDAGWGRGSRPVVNVSWDDLQQYLAWLSRETGHQYRLPTEAEWEYATRAGTATTFSTGDCIDTRQANFSAGIAYPGCAAAPGETPGKTQPVGSYPANPWGLFDLHGNVWEWVQDCWHAQYTGAPADGSAWSDACTDAEQRVLRGGSWDNDPHFLRAAFRLRALTGLRSRAIGFRVARTPVP